MRQLLTLCALNLWLSTLPASAIELNTLEWPPYTSAGLPGQGVNIELIRQALMSQGQPLKVNFMPWNRAIKSAQTLSAQTGYFPVYRSQGASCNYSESLGTSLLVMAQRQDSVLSWNSIDDLADYKIGVVSGYNNSPEFDQKVSEGKLQVEKAASDRLNLLKLLYRRIDFAVIDSEVMAHWLENDPELRQSPTALTYHPMPLAELTLHVCFVSGPEANHAREVLNRGLKTLQAHNPQNQTEDGSGSAGK